MPELKKPTRVVVVDGRPIITKPINCACCSWIRWHLQPSSQCRHPENLKRAPVYQAMPILARCGARAKGCFFDSAHMTGRPYREISYRRWEHA